MLPELKKITPPPAVEGMPNVDVSDGFASAISHGKQTGGAGSQGALAWLSKSQSGGVQSLGKWNRQTAVDWGGDDNTVQLPQSQRAQPRDG